MITRKRVKNFNTILTCLLCKGYLIEATTINTCMHSCKPSAFFSLKIKSHKLCFSHKTQLFPFLLPKKKTVCRSCIVKHVKVFEKYFCPNCEAEIRLSNLRWAMSINKAFFYAFFHCFQLRPDMRLRSLVYKLIPGLYAKEQLKSSEANGRPKTLLNGSAHSLNGKHDRQPFNEACGEDESLSKQYFYDQDEPIR